jgi:hypothetical protein
MEEKEVNRITFAVIAIANSLIAMNHLKDTVMK